MKENVRFKRCARLVVIVAGMVLFGAKSGAEEPTLCQPHEEVYFSCHSVGKIISICASGNISPDNGYVQYRFGVNEKIEFEYPSEPFPPLMWFSISDIYEGGLSFTHLKFSSNRFHYVLYQGDISGIYIKRNGRVVSNHQCDHGAHQPLNPRVFRGIKTVAPIDGIDN